MKTTNNIKPAAAVLWASAFFLAAMVIIQAGKLPGNPAYAEMGVSHGGYTLMTINSGRGGDTDPDELLLVLDSRSETLLIYEVEDAQKEQIFLRDGGNLRGLFQTFGN